MKRFYLKRTRDSSGVSGTGRVAEGVEFKNGWCALIWLSELSSLAIYPSMGTLMRIHGHHGDTESIWIDTEGTPGRDYIDGNSRARDTKSMEGDDDARTDPHPGPHPT